MISETPSGSVTRGRFIVFEGPEGSGKSTQAARLAATLDAVLTREPGDSSIGAELRGLLLSTSRALDARTEALLMAADRAQHVVEVIEPALAAGRHVVCDRYIGSSIAYQGTARGLGDAQICDLSLWATGSLQADLVVHLDIADDVFSQRVGSARDRIEAAGADFHAAVARSYRAQATADPQRWVTIDGSAPVDEVTAAVSAAVSDRLGLVL